MYHSIVNLIMLLIKIIDLIIKMRIEEVEMKVLNLILCKPIKNQTTRAH